MMSNGKRVTDSATVGRALNIGSLIPGPLYDPAGFAWLLDDSVDGQDFLRLGPSPIAATINGTEGDDTLVDTNDADTLNGLGGNDTLTVNLNQDTANGGMGIDRLIVNYGAATSALILTIGGSNAEGLFGTITESAARGVAFTGIEHFTINAGSGNDNITTGSGDDVINAGSGANTINSGSGNDSITTSGTGNTINAGDGNDIVAVGSGANVADGGDGVDGINSGVSGTVTWNLQTNSLTGSAASFTNFEYFDHLGVGSGSFAIITGTAALTDVITETNASGSTTISVFNGIDYVNYRNSGPDKLIVDYSNATAAVTMVLNRITSTLTTGWVGSVQEGDGSVRKVNFTGLGAIEVISGSGNDNVIGASQNDLFKTNGGNDTVDGGDGSDTFQLSGNRANYLVTQNPNGSLTITDVRGGSPDGTDVVRNVENFAFADGTITAAALLANPPAIDLNGAAFGTDNSANYSEGGAPTILAPAAVVTDPDSTTLGGATVRISSGFQPGFDVLSIAGANSGTITGIVFQYSGSTGVLTLSGTASIADYQALLRQVAFSTTSTAPTPRPIVSWALNDGTVTGVAANTEIVVQATSDDPAIARNDAISTNEASMVAGNLFANNGSGADSDPDGGSFVVTAINGTGPVGAQITLPSGALLTVNANGTFSYNPNGAFNATPAPGSGASNQPSTDSFTYTITGGSTATVTVTIAGLDTNDVLIGTAGNDTLNGGAGADQMFGLAGDDYYFVNSAGDQVFEISGQGTDQVLSSTSWALGAGQHVEYLSTTIHNGTAAINLTGNAFSQTIYGNAGANTLNGGGGGDVMIDFGGNDFFFVGNVNDLVYEFSGGGVDQVLAGVSWTLNAGSYVEYISTTDHAGTGSINLSGNELAQTIYGNNGANWLDGGGGGDVMLGSGGDDFYFVRSAADLVYDDPGSGAGDRVFASVSWMLNAGAQIEIMSTTNHGGAQAIDLKGNEFNQTIFGNEGANRIDGGHGADILEGRGGADIFAFTTSLGGGNIDTITDFALGIDKLGFAGVTQAQLAAGGFRLGNAAQDADDRILYDQATGALFYDGDGNGAGAAVQFATVGTGLTLTANDFVTI